MVLPQVSILTPLIFAGVYALLLVGLIIRLGWQDKQVRWLLILLFVGIFWQLAMLPTPLAKQQINLGAKILLLNTFTLGLATAAYVDWKKSRLWLLGGIVILLVAFSLDLLLPNVLYDQPPKTTIQPTVGGLSLIPIWLLLNFVIFKFARQGYHQAQLPLHGNRLLFWLVSFLTVIIGEAMLFINEDGIIIGEWREANRPFACAPPPLTLRVVAITTM
jgi:hypothetical protein